MIVPVKTCGAPLFSLFASVKLLILDFGQKATGGRNEGIGDLGFDHTCSSVNEEFSEDGSADL
jgi:hypothetical protein